MLDFFGWLRRKARDAVLGGIGDAAEQVAAGDVPDLEKLRSLLAEPPKALAAAPDDEPKTRRKG
jgi:hypothetical protein